MAVLCRDACIAVEGSSSQVVSGRENTYLTGKTAVQRELMFV
jgi:hypothetical protein